MPTGVSPSAKSSRMTGTTRWSAAQRVELGAGRAWPVMSVVGAPMSGSPIDGVERVDVEAACACRCGRPAPICSTCTQQRVAVAVERGAAHVLDVAGGVALAPVLLARARPEGDAALGQGAAERLGVHPAEHEHLAGVPLLDDRRQQAVVVEARRASSTASTSSVVESRHRTSIPAVGELVLDLADRQLARGGTRSPRAPRPRRPRSPGAKSLEPRRRRREAITGTRAELAHRARRARGRSPSFVPSASIELTSSSPAPRSIASRAQSRASSVGLACGRRAW